MKGENNLLYKFGVLLLISLMTSLTYASGSDIDNEVRKKVVDAIASKLDAEYVFPDIGKKMADRLRTKEKEGKYEGISDGRALSEVFTNHLREVSGDKHINVGYFKQKPNLDISAAVGEMAGLSSKKTFDFVKYTHLTNSIALIELNSFPPPEVGDDAITKVMNEIVDTKALIIDLRNNGGGSPEMVALISSYLFGEIPIHLNDLSYRRSTLNKQYWTQKELAGKRYGLARPVYVLTSSRTFSAAEEFSYNLKNLNRATIVGEVTGGGANPGDVFIIDENFSIFIPTGRAINPITKTNWEGVGVNPDVQVPSGQALSVAQKLAREKIK